MSFNVTKSTVLITTTDTGVYMGTSITDLTTTYQVKTVHLRLGGIASADLYVSYDAGSTWTLHGSYDVAIAGDVADVYAAAEASIKALAEFSA